MHTYTFSTISFIDEKKHSWANLLKLTTSEHDIYKPSICNYEEQNNIAELLRWKVLTIAVTLYNFQHAGTHIDIR